MISKLESIFKNKVEYIPFKIPFDITDGFFYAGWQEPEKYLNENFRNSISVFAKSPKESVYESINKLKTDLDNGKWDEKYGNIRNQNCLLYTSPSPRDKRQSRMPSSA